MSQSPSATAKKTSSFKQPAQPASEAKVSKTASRPQRKARLMVTPNGPVAPMAIASKSLVPGTKKEPTPAAGRVERVNKPVRRPDTGKRMSALDAAATVLASLPAKDAAQGLSAGDLIAKMEAGKLWTSAAGKTPSATLYAAMMREITLKGSQSRFCRPAAGRFALLGTQSKGKTKDAVVKVKTPKGAKA